MRHIETGDHIDAKSLAGSGVSAEALLARLPCGFLVLDGSLHTRHFNASLAHLLGRCEGADLRGLPLNRLFPSAELEACARKVLAAGDMDHEVRIVSTDLADDSPCRQLSFNLCTVASPEGDCLLVTVHAAADAGHADIRKTLRDLQSRHAATLGQTVVGIAYASPHGHWLQVNRAFSRLLTGHAHTRLPERSVYDIVCAGDAKAWVAAIDDVTSGRKRLHCQETHYTHGEGTTVWVRLNMEYVQGQGPIPGYLLLVAEDISGYRHTLMRLRHLEDHDQTTGLANSGLFVKRLEEALSRRESGQTVAVVLVHPDRLDAIKHMLGRDHGESLMTTLAQRLVDGTGNVAGCARLDSDTLAVLLVTRENQPRITERLTALSRALSQPAELAGCDVATTFSIGIAATGTTQAPAREILRRATQALQHARRSGGDRIRWHEGTGPDGGEWLRLETEVAYALRHDQLTLRFQPRVNVENGAYVGVEALPYWRHPRRGLLSADEFLPAVDDTPVGDTLSAWVLRGACRQVRLWNDAHRDLAAVVRIPASQMRRHGMVELVRDVLHDTGLESRLLELEMNGGDWPWKDREVLDNLRRLHSLGVRLAVGDFGTGHICLEHLKRAPIDVVRIHRDYLAGAIAEPDAAAIVKTILAVGEHLRLDVVAEGVEHPAQIDFLRTNRCAIMQGAAFGQPMTAADIDEMLRENRQLPPPAADTDADQRVLMILDDEENILLALTRLLRRDGYRILAADCPEKAFELLAANPVGVIISDQRMPAMKGTEFLSRAKALYPAVVRIMLTGYAEMNSITEAINSGSVFRFLSKPWDEQLLRSSVRAAFELHEIERENIRLNTQLRQSNEALLAANQRLLKRRLT